MLWRNINPILSPAELKPKRSLSPPPPTIGDRLDVVTKVRRILPKAKTELPPGKSDSIALLCRIKLRESFGAEFTQPLRFSSFSMAPFSILSLAGNRKEAAADRSQPRVTVVADKDQN